MMTHRPDGRSPNQLRRVTLTRGIMKFAEASCLVEWGHTKVICTATVEEKVPPFLRNSGTGWVTAEYGMLPRSSQQRIERESIRGRVGGRTQEIQRLIGRSLRAVIDLSKLGERSVIIDCDVIQADGGTRTAAISGSYVALCLAVEKLRAKKLIAKSPIKDSVAAVSAGIVKGNLMLDLDYSEDSSADVDLNLVMTGKGKFVELQATGERASWDSKQLDALLKLGELGIKKIIQAQKRVLIGR